MIRFFLCIAVLLFLSACASIAGKTGSPTDGKTSGTDNQQNRNSLSSNGDSTGNTDAAKTPPTNPSGDGGIEITVTEAVYNDTFRIVENLILELNSTIQKGDYNTWLTYLTDDYKKKYSDDRVLKELSESPTLKDNSIRLRTLRDYFERVVAPSRIRVVLDRIVFINEHQIRAIAVIQETSVILYSLREENGSWKIATE